MTAALVIARGGSKRLPRKNVKPFCGIPLVAWSVIQAKCSHLIDEVYVSTDDEEIADISASYGAEIITRPDWPDADLVAGSRPTAHGIRTILAMRPDFDLALSLLPTRPCRYPDELDRMITLHNELGGGDDISVGHMCPRRETVLGQIISNGYVKMALFDKHYRFCAMPGGTGVSTPAKMLAGCAPEGQDHDSVQDAASEAHAFDWPDSSALPAIEVQMWQTIVDTDTAEEFELGEVLMDHYITGGRGPAVYYEYAGDYRHLAGNARQL